MLSPRFDDTSDQLCRNIWRRGDDILVSVTQSIRRIDQGGKNEADLLQSTSRKQTDQRDRGIHPMLAEKFLAIEPRPHPADQRMAEVFHWDPCPSVNFLLEWKDNDHPVNAALNLLEPAFAPGPNLRTHKIDHRDPQLFEPPGQIQIKGRGINEYSQQGAFLFYHLNEFSVRRVDRNEMASKSERGND